MFDPQIIGELCAMYGIDQPITYSSNLLDGLAPRSHLITTKSSYTLVCIPETYALRTLNCEHGLIRYLERQGYPTPRIHLTRYGTTAALVNKRLYVLMEALADTPYDATQLCHLRAAARGLGAFHYLTQAYTGQPPQACFNSLEQPSNKAETILQAAMAAIGGYSPGRQDMGARELVEILQAELQPLRATLNDVDPNLVRCTIIHGSYCPEALRYQGETLANVLDYQYAHWGPRLTDLAQAINSFCSDQESAHGGALDLDRVQFFMEAYRERCVMCYEETALLPLIMRANCVNNVLKECSTLLAHRRNKREGASRITVGDIISYGVERLAWLDVHGVALVHAATSRKTTG